MGITSLQVCMDSSDWLHQGTISEEYIGGGIMDSSPISTPSGGGGGDDENNINSILACGGRSPTLLAAERSRLRPQHEQSPKCPRCESTHTKFCYYNNYSLSQPRYFCKTCRRYWTKGGTLRNIPVGGGCRKNKKVSSSSSAAANKKSDHHPPPPSSALVPLNRNNHNNNNPSGDDDENHVHLGFSDQLHFSSLHASGFFNNAGNNNNFVLDNNNNNIINNHHTPIDFMDNKYDDFGGMMITGNGGGGNNAEEHNAITSAVNFHGFPFGLSSSFLDHHHHHGGSNSAPINILESCQRLMLPYDNPNQNQNHDYNNHNHNHNNHEVIDVKPNSKILSLEWNDYHNHHHQQSTGYNFGGLGSWTGLMNGYGSNPATNPLV